MIAEAEFDTSMLAGSFAAGEGHVVSSSNVMAHDQKTKTQSLPQLEHLGGYQNYGPFLDPYYDTAPNIWVPKKGP